MKATGYNSKISWISMMAVAVIGLLISVPARLSGLFFVIILDTYNVSREESLLPIVTIETITMIPGPLVGYLGQIFGLQVIIFIGCILISVGTGLSCFTEDIISLTICFGFIYGTGFSLSVNLINSVIRQHFTDYLSLTQGIFITAVSLGATLMTPCVHYLTNFYGTSGMFLILSGIFLHTIPAVIYLKNPKNEEREYQKNLFKANFTNYKQVNKEDDSEIFSSVGNEQKINDIRAQFSPIETRESVCSENENMLSFNGNVNVDSEIKSKTTSFRKQYNQREDASKEEQALIVNPRKIKIVTYFKSDTDIKKVSPTVECEYNESTSEETVKKPFEAPDSKTSLKKKNSKALIQLIRLIYNPNFLLQMVIQSGYAFGFALILSVHIDYARDKQISLEDALYFSTFMPITQIFGSLGFNWITDGAYMTRTNFFTICYFILALDLLFLIWSSNFTSMMVGYLVYGCVNGATGSLLPGMIMDNIEKEQQHMALASRFTLYGLLCTLKSPLVGYFRGHLKSYDGIYYIMIGISVFCGVLAKLPQVLEKCK